MPACPRRCLFSFFHLLACRSGGNGYGKVHGRAHHRRDGAAIIQIRCALRHLELRDLALLDQTNQFFDFLFGIATSRS
jgi:hypothetical protein